MKPLIAIYGKFGAGKSTLAKALSEKYQTPIDSFAAPLKEACRALGIVTAGPDKDREALQNIATFVTNRDGWHFCRMMEQRNPNFRETGLIIDDMRRPEEFLWAQTNGFFLVKIEVSPEVQRERGFDLSFGGHKTETALEGIPWWSWSLHLPQAPVERWVEAVELMLEVNQIGHRALGPTR